MRIRLIGLGRAALAVLSFVVVGAALPSPAAVQSPQAGAGKDDLARPLVIAHRGGRKWAPENTMAAFQRSINAHADGIELDIHRCKTGELIVIHDETLPRTTNGTGFVKDKTLAELRALDAGSWYSPKFKGEKLPLLSEVLEAVDGKLTVNIEIKNTPVAYPGIEDALIALLSTYRYPDKIIVSSFDHAVINAFHKKAPQYKTAMLDDAAPSDVSSYATGDGAYAWNPDFAWTTAQQVKAAHQAGLKVFPWTPNKRSQWRQLRDLGVDGIITDDPLGLMGALKR